MKNNLLYTHININIIKYYLINFINKYNNKIIEEFKGNKIIIEINSILFDIFSNFNIFEKIFSILVKFSKSQGLINVIREYFENLNKNNIKYTSIIYQYQHTDEIKFLGKLNINFNQLKKLAIKQELKLIEKNSDYFFHTLFSCFQSNYDNLIYLDIQIEECIVKSYLIKNILNFKFLETLKLKGFLFHNNSIFFVEFKNLKEWELINCENISINPNFCSNIKYLILTNTKNIAKSFLKLTKLEICKFNKKFIDCFDFSSFINLKQFTGLS